MKKWAIVVPVANEEETINQFVVAILKQITKYNLDGTLYLVIDSASKDNTFSIIKKLEKKTKQIKIIFEPKNRNVVDAYTRGFKEALIDRADYIIEMDSGFSHSPHQLKFFIYGLLQGNDCVFGYRSLTSLRYRGSNFRRFVSLGGTWISSALLGTRLRDITSGYEGFTSNALKKIIHKPFLSSAHFWHVELKARAREMKYIEVPITYQFPSPRMNFSSILNSLAILSILVLDRLKGK